MRLIYLLVFVGGLTTLGVELSAARLLAPWFGNSLPVWASLIGLILVYLSLGYWLGGRLADRDPRPRQIFRLGLWAGLWVGLIPPLSRPILRMASQGFAVFDAGLLAGSFVGVMFLFALPVTLLGCISPFAIRLVLDDVVRGGQMAGRIYALSTLGSIVGTFLPVLLLIPAIGTRKTFVALSILLLLVSLLGWLRCVGRRGVRYTVFLLLVLTVALLDADEIKTSAGLLEESESPYNYIYVLDRQGERWLKLNEGAGLQSVYLPGADGLAEGIWDYFLVAPFFNEPPFPPERVENLLMIGLAGGTISRLYTEAFGPIPIDGIELDPEVIRMSRKWLGMNQPNLNAIAQDGRVFLAHSEQIYDVIVVDAYRPPYIPFHLTTVEFFQEARAHLSDHGVVAVNVGRLVADYRLVDAVTTTMGRVFPSVYVVDEPDFGDGLANSLVVATAQPTVLENLQHNLADLAQPMLVEMVKRAIQTAKVAPNDGVIFTDDLAPVEQVTHELILDYLVGR